MDQCPTGFAETPDGTTPALETICEEANTVGKAKGLCIAYCEAMDCDGEPKASQNACDSVGAKLAAAHGSIPCVDEVVTCPCGILGSVSLPATFFIDRFDEKDCVRGAGAPTWRISVELFQGEIINTLGCGSFGIELVGDDWSTQTVDDVMLGDANACVAQVTAIPGCEGLTPFE